MLGERLSAWFGADHGDVVRDVLSGKECILKFGDLKHYPCRTLTACHFAGLNFVRVGFQYMRMQRTRSRAGTSMGKWLSDIRDHHVLEEILSPCERLNGEQSIQLDEMYHVPLFENTLEHVSTKYSPPSMILLKQSLRQMQLNASPVSAMVVSRNASTTVCLKLHENSKSVFLILDFAPIPKPAQSRGHSVTLTLVISTSLEQTAARLSGILPVDNHMMTRDRQWQAQLFTSCTICMFTPAEGVGVSLDTELSVINQSIALLKVMGEIDVRGQDLESGREMDRQRDRNLEGDQPSGSSRRESSERMYRVSPTTSCRYAGRIIGGLLQGRPGSRMNPRTTFTPYEQTKRHGRIFLPGDFSSPSSSQISTQISSEASTDENNFECVICFENIPEEEGIHLLPCTHGFCRSCLAGHVCSKIEERRYPVFCPLCMTEHGNVSPSGRQPPFPSQVVAKSLQVVSRALAQRLQVSEARYMLWSELETAHLYVRVHCSRCNHSTLVDKEDYEKSEEINCSYPGCMHTWCKTCQQSISVHSKHSCDGTEELDNLMRQMGWKHCPRCKTPVQKNGGCNHMTCVTPACNTHFCYRCGKQITRTSIPFLVRSAVNAHFKQCTL